MKIGRSATLSLTSALALFSLVSMARVHGQSGPTPSSAAPRIASAPARPAVPRPAATRAAVPAAPAAAVVAEQKALIDQYCVTCHNNRVKTSNLSLEGADLATRQLM